MTSTDASRRIGGRRQDVTLTLEGVTAADYLAWMRDPEPPALGRGLRSIAVRASSRGDRVHAALAWDGAPPPVRLAAVAAGLPLTPEVVAVRDSRELIGSRELRSNGGFADPDQRGEVILVA